VTPRASPVEFRICLFGSTAVFWALSEVLAG